MYLINRSQCACCERAEQEKRNTEFSSIAKLLIAFFLLSFCSDVRPAVISGLKELRVLKTTRSSFVDFVDDEYRSLPDMEDRLFR